MSKYTNKYKKDFSVEKFDRYKIEAKDEIIFLKKLNTFFTSHYQDLFEDILLLSETKLLSQLKNLVEKELEEIFSEKCLQEELVIKSIEKGLNEIKSEYISNYKIAKQGYDSFSKNKNSPNNETEFLTKGYRRHCINEVDIEYPSHVCSQKLGKFIVVKNKRKIEILH